MMKIVCIDFLLPTTRKGNKHFVEIKKRLEKCFDGMKNARLISRYGRVEINIYKLVE